MSVSLSQCLGFGEIFMCGFLLTFGSAMEYERHVDSYWDPFASIYNVTADGLGGQP